MIAFRSFEAGVFSRFRRKPPAGFVARGAFWLLLIYLCAWILSLLPGDAASFFRVCRALSLICVAVFGLILLVRWVSRRLLWKVRNRLIVTYLLMGLTPLVLAATLALLVGYIFFGQFATFAASSAWNTELVSLSGENRDFTLHVAQALAEKSKAQMVRLPDYALETQAHGHEGLQLAAFTDGRKIQLLQGAAGQTAIPTPPSLDAPPAWAANGFKGFAIAGSALCLRSIESETQDGHTAVLVASLPVGTRALERLAEGLGTIHIFQREFGNSQSGDDDSQVDASSVRVSSKHTNPGVTGGNLGSLSGGHLPAGKNLLDVPVEFFAPVPAIDWKSGKAPAVPIVMGVTSRPSLLYERLFTTSVRMGSVIRDAFLSIAIFFGVLELIAFLMAMRLNRTITESIHQLYTATTEIDRGDLTHRIVVKRQDQLGALSQSFNRMAASLDRLLAEQREKQRMEYELTIAQQVQENLFPRGNLSLTALEIYGKCRPARTVSGDYYDFVVLGERRLFLALGDISGKGISAALLMATLHSAIRAYQFAGAGTEEAPQPDAPASGSHASSKSRELQTMHAGLFSYPGELLALLNRQLYASTQPEKYATLFLAHYEAGINRLTYANGGHLPPMILCSDGTVKRLREGGPVVGLMDNLRYEQGSITLSPGDLFIAYSDGVTEPENEFGEFGEERLLEVVARHRHLPLAAIADQVLQTLRAWIGDQEQPDDITLVLARHS